MSRRGVSRDLRSDEGGRDLRDVRADKTQVQTTGRLHQQRRCVSRRWSPQWQNRTLEKHVRGSRQFHRFNITHIGVRVTDELKI